MDNEDIQMDEDTIMDSTETNGPNLPETINPANIYDTTPLLRKEQLPFHGPSQTQSHLYPAAHRSHPGSHRTTHSPGGRSDRLYVPTPMSERPPSPQVRIPPRPRHAVLPYATSRTGLVYDPRMRFHAELPNVNLITADIHPEDPRRIHSIFQEIKDAGLVGSSSSNEDAREDHCWRISIRPATKPEILLIHTEKHYDFIESLPGMDIETLKMKAENLDSIYFNHSTFECAKLAAGGAIEACKAVVEGSVRNAIAIIRPPGHHAESTQPSGFCIFNNVPIATRVCQNAYPELCRKVLILDWDVHHGNGIQHAFYDDPNVLYISLHVFKDATFYPMLPDGNLDYCGEGLGEGRNVNIPWAEFGMGDAEYLYAFQEVIMPIATEFDPDLVIISAGFDAADGDVLGGCHVTPPCYGHMTHMLMRLAKGKLVVCLEGGYNLRSIAKSALAVTRVLMQEPPDRLDGDAAGPKDSAVRVVQQVKHQHSKYWKCLYPKHAEKNDPGYSASLRLNEIIRQWQSQCLSDEHRMTPLFINKAGLTQSFEHHVLATPDFTGRHPLLLIFHDPPSCRDYLDPVTGRRELHNTWLTDITKKYIDWAIENEFQVIDVNIPLTVGAEDTITAYSDADKPSTRAFQTRELARYLWDNYIEPNDATQVFLMGIGDAYSGLLDLLSFNENCTDGDTNVQYMIGFAAETPIRKLERPSDDPLHRWYREHSLIFVKNSHDIWLRDRRPPKKYGGLIRSSKETLDEMLEQHFEEVQNLLLDQKRDPDEVTDEETDDVSNRFEDGLRDPPTRSLSQTPKILDGPDSLRNTRLPQKGLFPVPSPRSPKSPVKRPF